MASGDTADPALRALIEQHSAYFKYEGGKVHCTLNGHAFPARLDVVQAFIR